MNNYHAGGLIRGISDGVALGSQLINAYQQNEAYKDQQEVKNVMADGLTANKQARADDITANSQVGSKANDSNTMTMPTFDDTRGNSYANADEQKAGAEKNAPSMEELYMKNVVPKVRETYIAQGNMAAADKWDEWVQDKQTRTALGHLSKATIAGQMGDFKGAADNLIKTYNSPGYLEDGVHAEGYDMITDKDGNTTGMTLKMKNKTTGEVFEQKINGTQDMLNMGLAALDPRKAFEHRMATETAAAAAGYKVALEDHKTQNGMYRDGAKIVAKAKADSAIENQKAGNALDRVVAGKEMDGANKVKVAEIRAGVGQGVNAAHKKGASAQEAHRLSMQAMLSKYVDYNGRPTMSVEEMNKIATESVEASFGKGALDQQHPMSGGLPGTTTTQSQPPAGGAAPAKGVMRLDMKTGQVLPL